MDSSLKSPQKHCFFGGSASERGKSGPTSPLEDGDIFGRGVLFWVPRKSLFCGLKFRCYGVMEFFWELYPVLGSNVHWGMVVCFRSVCQKKIMFLKCSLGLYCFDP